MDDAILEACYDGLRKAGYGTAELDPGAIYVKAGRKLYSVSVIEVEDAEQEDGCGEWVHAADVGPGRGAAVRQGNRDKVLAIIKTMRAQAAVDSALGEERCSFYLNDYADQLAAAVECTEVANDA